MISRVPIAKDGKDCCYHLAWREFYIGPHYVEMMSCRSVTVTWAAVSKGDWRSGGQVVKLCS